MTLENRVTALEKRWRETLQRGIVAKGDQDTKGPYVVAIQDDYGHTFYITDVLWRPFTTELEYTVSIPGHEDVISFAHFIIHVPEHPNFSSGPGGNPSHSHNIPVHEHEPVTVTIVFPPPKIDDRVVVWAPTGQPSQLALIVGRY